MSVSNEDVLIDSIQSSRQDTGQRHTSQLDSNVGEERPQRFVLRLVR